MKNTKTAENTSTQKASIKPANKKVVSKAKEVKTDVKTAEETVEKKTPAVEKKVEKPAKEKKAVEKKETAPKFDNKAYIQDFINKFKDNETVDLICDTDLTEGPRATALNDYSYIHIFKKGTTKNCFQMYVSANKVRIVVGKNIESLMPEQIGGVTKRPKIKGEKLCYYDYLMSHEVAEVALKMLITAYKKFQVESSSTEKKDSKKKVEKDQATA